MVWRGLDTACSVVVVVGGLQALCAGVGGGARASAFPENKRFPQVLDLGPSIRGWVDRDAALSCQSLCSGWRRRRYWEWGQVKVALQAGLGWQLALEELKLGLEGTLGRIVGHEAHVDLEALPRAR